MRRISWILGLLAVVAPVLGAPEVITRYVDRDTGDNANNGTTPETAWATMAYAESQFNTYGENGDGDFTATGVTYPDGIVGHLYCAGSVADTAIVTWDVVTDGTHYMRITGDGEYTHRASSASSIAVSTTCIEFIDVHFVLPSTTANNRKIIWVKLAGAGGWQRFRGCTFTGPASETYTSWLVYANTSNACIELNNCKIIDAGSVENSRGIYAYAGTVYVYNCTINNCYYGIQAYDSSNSKFYAKNTIVTGSAGDAYNKGTAGTLQLTYCTADDATATTYDTGETCTNNVSPTFTGDYQLASTDTTWIDGGASLSADDHWHDDDVDAWDTARPQGSAWDIGWHEYESGESEPAPGPITRGFIAPFIFGN